MHLCRLLDSIVEAIKLPDSFGFTFACDISQQLTIQNSLTGKNMEMPKKVNSPLCVCYISSFI